MNRWSWRLRAVVVVLVLGVGTVKADNGSTGNDPSTKQSAIPADRERPALAEKTTQVMLQVTVLKVRPDLVALFDLDQPAGQDTHPCATIARPVSKQVFRVRDVLRNADLARVLAEPNLVTLSGQCATFLSGGEMAVPQGKGKVSFEEFGLRVSVVPTVLNNAKGNLRLEVETQDSEILAAAGNEEPSRNISRLHTTSEIQAGQTLAFHLKSLVETKAGTKRRRDLAQWSTVVLITPEIVDSFPCK